MKSEETIGIEKMNIEYREVTDVNDAAYRAFLYYKDGEKIADKFLKRVEWYFLSGHYKLLCASIEAKIVAHAAAYKVTAVIYGEEFEWWWGVDTFALPEARGKGIGKTLQAMLHQLPNFSSQAYSKINGNIKIKCGGKNLFHTSFLYYPCSSFISAVGEMMCAKIFGRRISMPKANFQKYMLLNRLLHKKRKYTIVSHENNYPVERYADFIDRQLTRYDFYIRRSPDYLRWKYTMNPSVRYVTMEIYGRQHDLIGLLIFSEVDEHIVYLSRLRVSMVLDCITSDENLFNISDAVTLIGEFYRRKRVNIDGVCALHNGSYFPKFSYPSAGRPLLSTHKADKGQIKYPYISYSDQDMEQI